MKRLLTTIIIVLFIKLAVAQTSIQKKEFVRKGDVTYIVSNQRLFPLNNRILTVKLFSGIKSLPKDMNVVRQNGLGYSDILVPEGKDIVDYATELEKKELFETIEYNSVGEYTDLSNDTYVNNQWYLNTINADLAWDFTMGSSETVVAILDSGVDYTHYDLGYGLDSYTNLDLQNAYNYITNNSNVITTNEHGTRVAGIVGAKTNNSYGISGICGGNGNRGISIIPLCVGVSSPDGSIIDDAIKDAVDKGAKVIQLSLSVDSTQAINDAINYAYTHDVTIVCAAGNNNSSLSFPASHPHVIAVGATDSNNIRAYFSNYGSGLDVVAPGVNIYSTSLNNGYSYGNGTSFSAPQVSGTIALMLSYNPTLTNTQIRNYLRESCYKIPYYTYNSSGWNSEVGYGMLDAKEVLHKIYIQWLKDNLNIIGNSVINNTSSYYIDNLPDSASVVWSLELPNTAVFSFQNAYPTANQCQITRLAQVAHTSFLQAKIVYEGDTIKTLNKAVFSHNATLTGTCEQPLIPGSLQPLTSPIIIYRNTLTRIISPNFGGMTCPYLPAISSGSIPAISKILFYEFDLILNNNLTIPFVSEDGNTSFIIDFFTYAKDYSLLTHMEGEELIVELSDDDEQSLPVQMIVEDKLNNMEWTVDVFCIENASVKTNKNVTGKCCSIDTSGWQSGTYVVMATIEGKTISKKIIIR